MSAALESRFSAEGHASVWGAWSDHLSPLFDAEQRAETDLGRPVAMRSFNIGGILVGDHAAPAQDLHRSNLKAARQGVDHLVLQFYVSGRSEVATEHGLSRPERSQAIVFDMAQPVTIRSHEPVEAVTLVVPRAALGDEAGALEPLHGTALDYGADIAGRLLFDYLRGIIAGCPQLAPHQLPGLAEAAAKLCAAFLRGAARGAPGAESRARQDIRAFVQSQLGRLDLDAAAIVKESGMSRAVLYREFAEEGGVMAYVRERRLAAALRLLTRPAPGSRGPRVSSVAYAVGFADEKSFSRAFKVRYGLLPREVRTGAPLPRAEAGDGTQVLRDWLRDLRA